jgi:hypothetical protein
MRSNGRSDRFITTMDVDGGRALLPQCPYTTTAGTSSSLVLSLSLSREILVRYGTYVRKTTRDEPLQRLWRRCFADPDSTPVAAVGAKKQPFGFLPKPLLDKPFSLIDVSLLLLSLYIPIDFQMMSKE